MPYSSTPIPGTDVLYGGIDVQPLLLQAQHLFSPVYSSEAFQGVQTKAVSFPMAGGVT